jgi:general secretion pathway protein D
MPFFPDDGSETISTRGVAGALSQIPGTTLGWGVVDQDLTMSVILNAPGDSGER